MSKYSNPERSGREVLISRQLSLESISFLKELIDAMPFMVMVMNEQREIIISNQAMINKVGIDDFREFFGKKPGEALKCIHFSQQGCGGSGECQLCGALNSIIKSSTEDKIISKEFRLSASIAGVDTWHDFLATSKPFKFNDTTFILFTLEDISSDKRKQVLERIFFHDLLNTAGNLKGISDLVLMSKDNEKKDELLKIMNNLTSELVDEIVAQKQLSSAETGQLRLNAAETGTLEIFNSVIEQFANNPMKKSLLKISEDSEDIAFSADRSLVIRIIKNMVKNALEASAENEAVVLESRLNGKILKFEVKNQMYISRNVQMQIFKRSFSTKAFDRGLGTYSMKILGERYLKGKIYFTSSEEEGTRFFFELPLKS